MLKYLRAFALTGSVATLNSFPPELHQSKFSQRTSKLMSDDLSLRQDSLRQESRKYRLSYRATDLGAHMPVSVQNSLRHERLRSCRTDSSKSEQYVSLRITMSLENHFRSNFSYFLEFLFHSLSGRLD